MGTTTFGREGENLAKVYLEKKGYKFLDRNFKRIHGEVDIIMMDGDVIVFVEVKSRHNRKYGDPIEAVNKYKQKHIRYCANLYLSSHRITDQSVRFDVVEVLASAGRAVRYRHTRNAF